MAFLAALPSLIGAFTGLGQAFTTGKKNKQEDLEKYAATQPQYAGSSALDQYYQSALQRANTAAQQSALYKQQVNAANRALAAGAGYALQGGAGQGAISKLTQQNVDAMGRAITGAEQQKEQRFGQLGQASQLKSAEDMRKFQINKMQPWETKYNLLAARAAQAARQQEAGLSNIVGSAMNLSRVLGAKNTGDGTSTNTDTTASEDSFVNPNALNKSLYKRFY